MFRLIIGFYLLQEKIIFFKSAGYFLKFYRKQNNAFLDALISIVWDKSDTRFWPQIFI